MVTVLAWALLVRYEESEQWPSTQSWARHIGIKEDVKKLKYLWDRIQSKPAEVRCQWSEKDLSGWAYSIGVDRERFIRTFVRIGADVFDADVVEWMSDQGTVEEGERSS
jgi:hypothetical protein